MEKNEYLTKPRKVLKEFLNSKPDEKFTVKQIYEGIGNEMSLSCIYRNLEILEKQGFIKRFAGRGWEGVYFQYIVSEHCKDFVHMTCTRCGKTVHLSDRITQILEKNLLEHEGFSLDREATTLYGICSQCKK